MDSISPPQTKKIMRTPPSIPLYNIDLIIENERSSWHFSLGMCDAGLVTPDQLGAADEIGGRRRKRQRLSRVIRAVFIETSLARKIRNRKLRRKSSRWEIREPSETTDEGSFDLNPTSPEPKTSKLSSPTKSDITTICLLAKNDQMVSKGKKCDNSSSFTACFFPVILLVLIFFGKVCAIFFTSTCLLGISMLSGDPEIYMRGKGLHLKHYLRGPLSDL